MLILLLFFLNLKIVQNIFKKVFSLKILMNLNFIYKNLVVIVTILFLSLSNILVEFFRASLILYVLGFNINLNFFFIFMVASVLGSASFLPLGLGVKDFSLGAYLYKFMPLVPITLFLIILRLSGEIFSACLGWLLFGREFVKLKKEKYEKRSS